MAAENNNWEEFFDAHAPYYMQNIFTQNTAAEIKFIIEELALPKGSAILDIGCGTGRHSVELAKHGFRMTGVDLSAGMLAQARQAAENSGVEIELIKSNALEYCQENKFEAALCLCEGAMALLSPDEDAHEHDLTILKNIYASLKPGGKFIMTTLSALRKIARYVKGELNDSDLNLDTMVETEKIAIETDQGMREFTTLEKGYTAGELRLLLHMAGFGSVNVCGGSAGNWTRQPLNTEDYEIMAIARKV